MSIRYPTADELAQGYATYEAEMFARRSNPLPMYARDQDERPLPDISEIVFCDLCGKRFDFARKGMAVMQRTLHRKRVHPTEPGEAEMPMI